MDENTRPMVTISVDEYFELRGKSETNLYLTERLVNLQMDINALRTELWEIKNKLNKEVI